MSPPRRMRSAVPTQPPRRRRARRRVGVATLLTGMVVGVAGGVAVGSVLLPSGIPLPGGPAPEVVAEAPSEPAVTPSADPAPTALPGDDVLATGDALTSLTPPPDILSVPPTLPDALEPLEPAGPAEPVEPVAPPPPDDGLTAADRAAGLLSLETPTSASGELVVVPGAEPAPEPDAPVKTIRVEVEDGLDIDGERFAETVMTTLNDPRGWGADGSVSFARTDGDADFRVVLASPDKIDEMCAPLKTVGTYSCGRYGHAALNHTRWVSTTDEFDESTVYRQYLVNHEVGHLLGHPHEQCPGEGELAPLMQQQTVGVAPCVPNPWPHPTP